MMKIKAAILILILTVSQGICADKITVTMRNDAPPFSFQDVDGNPAGLFVDIWRLWSEKMSQKIEFRMEPRKDTLESLKNGRADIHGSIFFADDIAQWISFSPPFYELSMSLIFPKNQGKIQSITELKGQKIGITGGSAQEQELRKQYPEIEFIPFNTIEYMIRAAHQGKVRAIVSNTVSVFNILTMMGFAGEFDATDENIFTRKINAGVLKDNKELLDLIDKGFHAISNVELNEIEKHWIADLEKRYFNQNTKKISLTAQEQLWIEKRQSINLGFTTPYPPFSFIDENNEPAGMAMDYLEILGKKTGISFQITETGSNEKISSLLKAKQIDGIPYHTKTPEREKYQNFTMPYTTINWIIVTRNDYPFIGSIKDMNGKKVGVINKSAAWEFLQKQTGIKLVPSKTQKDLWESVSLGNTDAVIQNIVTAGYSISKLKITNLKVAYTFTEKLECGLSIRKDMPELLSILNKAIALVTPEEHAEIHKRWMSLKYEQGIDWRTIHNWMAFIILIVLSVLITIFIWNRRLTKEINEHKQTEKMLIKSEKNLKEAQRIGNVGHWEYNLVQKRLYWSEQTFRIYGLSPGDIAPDYDNVVALFHPDDRQMVEDKFRKAITNKTTFEVEHRIIAPDGRIKYIAERASVQYDENGNPLTAIGSIADITNRKRSKQKLQEAKVAAEAATLAKSEFLASMSHEIRTPMNVIVNMSALLLETELNSEQLNYAQMVRQSSDILLSLINDILDFSKIEAGKLNLENTDFNLAEILGEVLRILGLKADEKGLWLTSRISDDVHLYLIGDPLRLRQILLNLVNNAIKFTDIGNVKISVNTEKQGETHATIRFKISDTGIGIPEDRIDRMFKPFSQADYSTTRKFGGTGLGLSISKKLVDMMGGEIGVEIEEGIGSTFWFTAVFEKREKRADEEKHNLTDKAVPQNLCLPSDTRILLVEDNILNQQVAVAILRKFNLTADIANNGKEAVEVLEKTNYDLVLMDIEMPEMNGMEATEIIRDSEWENRNIPIIAMTAHAIKGSCERFIAAGMNDYLTKPINISDFFAIISKHISVVNRRIMADGGATAPLPVYQLNPESESAALSELTQIFDLQDMLNRLGGDEALIKTLVLNFPKFLSEVIGTLKAALDRKNAVEIRLNAHTIKGMAANYSAYRLRDVAYQIECAGKEDKIDIAASLIEKLEQEAKQLISVLSVVFPDIFRAKYPNINF